MNLEDIKEGCMGGHGERKGEGRNAIIMLKVKK